MRYPKTEEELEFWKQIYRESLLAKIVSGAESLLAADYAFEAANKAVENFRAAKHSLRNS